jgi:UTP--glucose-1-phosphate uridylyltransferase
MKLKKAIFPVGGLGTRFLPATKAMPKEMLPVVDKPIIQYAFEEAIKAGFEEFIFITGRNKNIINNHFDHSYELQKVLSESAKHQELDQTTSWMPKAGNIAFIRQQEPLGLGHAVWCARNFIDENEAFAVLLPDELMVSRTPCLGQLRKAFDKTGGSIIAVDEVAKKDVSRYGIVALEKGSNKIAAMVEKPKPADAPSNLAIVGRYILNGGIFKHLENAKKGAGGEIQLTDAMAKMAVKNPFYAVKYEGQRFDCGNKAGFLEANVALALQRPDLKKDMQNILKKYAQ